MSFLRFIAAGAAAAVLLSATAHAEVPTDTVVRNLDGVQQCIKTYTVSPDFESGRLIEEPFEREGYVYALSTITKDENYFEDEKSHTETVTVKTTSQELSAVLEVLPSTKDYDDGKYSGVLSLMHSTIHTEAAGYENRSYTVSTTKEFEDLDSNDMSYIPSSTVKDGVTLALQDVDWQVQSSELVEDMLVPSTYKAVASYAGTGYQKTATGYVSTASYTGTVSCRVLRNITYTVTYVGTPVEPEPPEPEAAEPIEPNKTADVSSGGAEAAGETAEPVDTSEAEPPPDTPQSPNTESPPSEETTETPGQSDGGEESGQPDTEDPPQEPDPDGQNPESQNTDSRSVWPYVGGGMIVVVVLVGTALFVRNRCRRREYENWQEEDAYGGNYDGYGQQPYDDYGEEPYGYAGNASYDGVETPYEGENGGEFLEAAPYEDDPPFEDGEPYQEESDGVESDTSGDYPNNEEEPPPD